MEELKAPLQEHRCKSIEKCKTVSISQRNFDGKNRWMWEQTKKDGKIAANEITFCPYCGVNLNSSAQDKPLTLEQLRRMDKKYVPYVEYTPAKIEPPDPQYENVKVDCLDESAYSDDGYTRLWFEDYAKTGLAYARKPEGSSTP